MSCVSAATPVDKPIHCSHLSIKSLPALSEWTCTKCLFQQQHHLNVFPLSGQTMDADGDILYIIAWAASGETQRSY